LAALPVLLLAAPPGEGLQAVSETPDTGIDTHRGYAFQWFSLAATTAGLYLYFTFFRKARPLP
jgi:surfeit locus 1 family protein